MFMSHAGWSGSFADPSFSEAMRLRMELHQRRVGALSRIVALHMGLTRAHASKLAAAAVLHDIGKVFVPTQYLQKRGALNDDEWSVVRQHPVWGHIILSPCQHPVLRLAAVIALQHHENWDGSGYPHQLSGEQICLEARIVTICDVYDALRHDRPYHDGVGHEKAVNIIARGDGRTRPGMFDPAVQKAFLECSSKLALVFADRMHRSRPERSGRTTDVDRSDLPERFLPPHIDRLPARQSP
jgi:putative two-component system response regulator